MDYGSLRFEGHFFISPLGHNLVLSSQNEIILYVCSPTGMENLPYNYASGGGTQIRLTELPFPDGEYEAKLFDPKSGYIGSRKIRIQNGDCIFGTPFFIDDIAIQIIRY